MRTLGKREISPKKWGAICDYDKHRYSHSVKGCAAWYGTWRPRTRVIHWGGSNPYNVATPDDAMRVMRGIDRYHVRNRLWSAAAYNRAFGGGAMLRVRGAHPNGAHTNSGVHGEITDACLFLVAHPTETPLWIDRHNFAVYQLADPLPVVGHGSYPEQSTQCPGPWLDKWIDRKGWVEDFGEWAVGDKGYAVRAIRRRLRDLGYRVYPWRQRYTNKVRKTVARYQRDQGLPVSGVVDAATYRALTNLP